MDRKNVFKVHHKNLKVYLFEAESEDSMNRWGEVTNIYILHNCCDKCTFSASIENLLMNQDNLISILPVTAWLSLKSSIIPKCDQNIISPYSVTKTRDENMENHEIGDISM